MNTRRLLFLAVAALKNVFFQGAQGEKSKKAPNVVIIIADDLGSADLSFSSKKANDGYAAIETPEIDALVSDAGGIHLEKSYTHQVCGCTRASLLTGRLAHQFGNSFATPLGGSLDKKFKTIGHEFLARGYSTHFIGKWGVDFPSSGIDPLDKSRKPYEVFNGRESGIGPTERGFETFYGIYSSVHNHFTKEVMNTGIDWHSHNKTHKLDYPDVDHEPLEYSSTLFTREAVKVIESWRDKPGFLHLSYTAPHDPLQAPENYISMPSCQKMRNWRRRTYCGMVLSIDEGVGRLRHALETTGQLDNTVILFISDNGGAPSVGGFNYPFKGQKATLYEGGIRNAALLYVPRSLGAVRTKSYENVIHVADYGITLLSVSDKAAGRTEMLHNFTHLGSSLDGVDHSGFLIGELINQQEQQPPRRETVLEYNIIVGNAAYLEGNWKLLLGNAGEEELFREPTGTTYDGDGRTQFVIADWICDIIDAGFGPDPKEYCWLFRQIMMKFSSKRDPDTQALSNLIWSSEFGDTVPISQNNLPVADWSKYDLNVVQLYNLHDDPHETENVALENRELVEAMTARLVEKVRNGPGHHLSIQKQFFAVIINIFILIGFTVIFLLVFLLFACFKLRRGSRTGAKSKLE